METKLRVHVSVIVFEHFVSERLDEHLLNKNRGFATIFKKQARKSAPVATNTEPQFCCVVLAAFVVRFFSFFVCRGWGLS